MSAARISTARPASALAKAMPEGPPIPVIRTRRGRPFSAGIGGSFELGDGGRHRLGVALAHDLERLDVAGAGEAGPVARGGPEQLLVEVGPDRRLRPVGPDGVELALDEGVDGDEAGGTELDRGRGRLVAVDPRDPARGDDRGVVDAAVVLVDVTRRVRVDGGRVDLVDH